MTKGKQLSNPFSTGGGGANFEAHVQASFVTLMLTGGYAPCLPNWPTVEVKLQGKIQGYDTDDLIVVVEKKDKTEKRKLLGQVKHSIDITKGSDTFSEVIQAAWCDFNNPKIFTRGRDVIALITGPLSKTDGEVSWLLNHARVNGNDYISFFNNVGTSNFSSNTKREKLEVIREHLKIANEGVDVDEETVHQFLKSFYLIGYDLGEEEGVILSLIHSHLSQFNFEYPKGVWSRIRDFTSNMNQHAGVITLDKIPDDLKEQFSAAPATQIIPASLLVPQISGMNWNQYKHASLLALLSLIGSWSDKNPSDQEAVALFLGYEYDEFLTIAQDLLQLSDSPISLKNGIWNVKNRTQLWTLLAARIFDNHLNQFKKVALQVLQEMDPIFELVSDERHLAYIHGKQHKYSEDLRNGIADGLAMLSTQVIKEPHWSRGMNRSICASLVHELFKNADWVLWGSLNSFLPSLAEASPSYFLEAAENALILEPCPFDELFSQEGKGITGRNYLTGLLWALETLAWDEQYLVRVCNVLAELAMHDTGGQYTNRPSNSLVTILLPWHPQTMAGLEKQRNAVQTVLKEFPDIGWNLIVQLLPNQHRTTMGSSKPKWLDVIPDEWEPNVTNKDYWEQVSFYSGLAVEAAITPPERLITLIEHCGHLPDEPFAQLCSNLTVNNIVGALDEIRFEVWSRLENIIRRHQQYSHTDWAMPEERLEELRKIAESFSPTNKLYLYQPIFSNNDFELYEPETDINRSAELLLERRKKAVAEILEEHGFDGIMQFAENVQASIQVGIALGDLGSWNEENKLFPDYLNSKNSKYIEFIRGYARCRFHQDGWSWGDKLRVSGWTPIQIGQFLALLPFARSVWQRVPELLGENEKEYWERAEIYNYPPKDELAEAAKLLVEKGKPHAAIPFLYHLNRSKGDLDKALCIDALLGAVALGGSQYSMGEYYTVELIKLLQSDITVDREKLCNIEWAYLPWLDGERDARPITLEQKLANVPEFFCETIRLIYRSKNEQDEPKVSFKEKEIIATNAWKLLNYWQLLPGVSADEAFDGDLFTAWYESVRDECINTGHLNVAMIKVGELLLHAPKDPSGLWIHTSVAAVLNERHADELREGYWSGVINSRGAHWIDPTGKPERDLAQHYREQAQDVESAGFYRFAVTLNEIAESYDRQAARIVDEYSEED